MDWITPAIAATPPTLAVLVTFYIYTNRQSRTEDKLTQISIGVDGKVGALIRAARAEGRLEANEARDLLNGKVREHAASLEQAREQGRQEVRDEKANPEHQ